MNRYSYFDDPDFSPDYYITDKIVNKYYKKPFPSGNAEEPHLTSKST